MLLLRQVFEEWIQIFNVWWSEISEVLKIYAYGPRIGFSHNNWQPQLKKSYITIIFLFEVIGGIPNFFGSKVEFPHLEWQPHILPFNLFYFGAIYIFTHMSWWWGRISLWCTRFHQYKVGTHPIHYSWERICILDYGIVWEMGMRWNHFYDANSVKQWGWT